MTISSYSIVMALFWFTIAAPIGSFILRRAEKYGLVFVSAIFLCTLLRCVLPLDYVGSIVIRSEKIYPMLLDLLAVQVCGSITIGQGLLGLWGAGIVFCLSRLLWELFRQMKFLHTVSTAGPVRMLTDLLEEVCDELGYHGKFRLTVSAGVSTAYQAGFLQPHILLPIEAYAFSDEDLRNIFRHELCHFLGRDLWIKTGVQIASCFLWWNPVMPLLKRSIEQLLELNCDRRACKGLSQAEQLDYLDTLMHFMTNMCAENGDITLSYLGNMEEAEIRQRFQFMLRGKTTRHSRFKLAGCCALCAGLFVASYCVILQPGGFFSADSEENVVIDAEVANSFILYDSNGALMYYREGKFFGILEEDDLKSKPYSDLQIYFSGGEK